VLPLLRQQCDNLAEHPRPSARPRHACQQLLNQRVEPLRLQPALYHDPLACLGRVQPEVASGRACPIQISPLPPKPLFDAGAMRLRGDHDGGIASLQCSVEKLGYGLNEQRL
jgi:hypothetical protein